MAHKEHISTGWLEAETRLWINNFKQAPAVSIFLMTVKLGDYKFTNRSQIHLFLSFWIKESALRSLPSLDLLKSSQCAETECPKEFPDLLTKTLFWYRIFCFSAWNNLEGSWKESPNSGKWNVTYTNWKKNLAQIFVYDMPPHLFCFCQIIFFVPNARSFQWRKHIFEKLRLVLLDTLTYKKQEGNFPLVQC